jgi:hypothetical protein
MQAETVAIRLFAVREVKTEGQNYTVASPSFQTLGAKSMNFARALPLRFVFLLILFFAVAPAPQCQSVSGGAATAVDSCGKITPRDCAMLSLDAMGGRERLDSLKTIRTESIGHTAIMEQSYRQDPFFSSYQHTHETLDLAGRRFYQQAHSTWPESDPGKSESDSTLIVGFDGGVFRGEKADSPCTFGNIETLRETLALGPARLMLTALQATDLHFEKAEMLRSTPHTVLAFTWGKVPVRILVNNFNHLPDAVETVQAFQGFWAYWGDVRQRIYFDNWMLIHGVVYPTNTIEERNGTIWQSTQAINVEFNVAIDEKQFGIDESLAQQSLQRKSGLSQFRGDKSTPLAPGVDLFLGAWNATIIQQSDGIVILEAPISGVYTQGIIDKAMQLHPGLQVKAVLSTSDSWPHVGGVRQSVADGLPVFILDLNRPLLDRFVNEPRKLNPDALAQSPKKPDWKIVSGKVVVGTGDNRVELYPLRGAGTERQYMVYFPAHYILYASDTLVLNSDGSLYDPELTYEVSQAVKREGLDVTTVFAMHQAPVPWAQVLALLEKAQQPATPSV